MFSDKSQRNLLIQPLTLRNQTRFTERYDPIQSSLLSSMVTVLLAALKWELNIIQLLVLVIKQFVWYIYNPRAFKFHFCNWRATLWMSLSKDQRLPSTKANVPDIYFTGLPCRLCQSDLPHSIPLSPTRPDSGVNAKKCGL